MVIECQNINTRKIWTRIIFNEKEANKFINKCRFSKNIIILSIINEYD